MTYTTTPKPLTLRQQIIRIPCDEKYKGAYQQVYRQGNRDALQAVVRLIDKLPTTETAPTSDSAQLPQGEHAQVAITHIAAAARESGWQNGELVHFVCEALRAQAASVEPVPIGVEAVATVELNRQGFGYLDWLVEGGISSIPEGTVLVIAHQPITDENGQGEVYTSAPPAHVPADVEALRYATDLAMALAKNFYPEVPDFSPFDNLPGILTQIDNMTCGLVRQHPTPEPAQAVDAQPSEYSDAARWLNDLADRIERACIGAGSPEKHRQIAKLLERAALQASRQPQAQQGGGEA